MGNKEIIDAVVDKLVRIGYYSKGQGDLIKNYNYQNKPELLLFDLDIAKEIWGEEPKVCSSCMRRHENRNDCDAGNPGNDLPAWQYHLMKMVLEKDRINYMRENKGVWDV